MKRVILVFAAILLLCVGCQAEESSDSISRVSRSKPSETVSYESNPKQVEKIDGVLLKVWFYTDPGKAPQKDDTTITVFETKEIRVWDRIYSRGTEKEKTFLTDEEYENLRNLSEIFSQNSENAHKYYSFDAWNVLIYYAGQEFNCSCSLSKSPELIELVDTLIEYAPVEIVLRDLA